MQSIDEVQEALAAQDYVCGRALATVVFLSLQCKATTEWSEATEASPSLDARTKQRHHKPLS